MLTKIHYRTEIKLDIFADLHKESYLIADKIKEVWLETYLADLDVEDYIDIITDLWLQRYILSETTKDAIKKIKQSNPPPELKIYLVFNLFDNDDNLKIDYSEIDTTPLFRAYLPTKDLWDTYIYSENKFKSLEIIEPAYIDEIKQTMTEQEKTDFDNIILKAYGFHQRLLGVTPKKIRLYTSQPSDKIKDWNTTGYIPIGTYFTDKMSRAEYYFETGDIIVDYRIPEDKIIQTSEFGGAKEFVTIDNIVIK